jgi:hypothetical protein
LSLDPQMGQSRSLPAHSCPHVVLSLHFLHLASIHISGLNSTTVGMPSVKSHPGHCFGGGSCSVPNGMRVLQCGHTKTGRDGMTCFHLPRRTDHVWMLEELVAESTWKLSHYPNSHLCASYTADAMPTKPNLVKTKPPNAQAKPPGPPRKTLTPAKPKMAELVRCGSTHGWNERVGFSPSTSSQASQTPPPISFQSPSGPIFQSKLSMNLFTSDVEGRAL